MGSFRESGLMLFGDARPVRPERAPRLGTSLGGWGGKGVCRGYLGDGWVTSWDNVKSYYSGLGSSVFWVFNGF